MTDQNRIHLVLSAEELAVAASALRQACIEIDDDHKFEDRIGVPRERARLVLARLVDALETD